MVATSLWWDIHLHTFDWTKGLILCGVVLGVAAAISRFTNRLLARPLTLLEAGITSVREGRLEPIRVSRTGDEIEYLGESFNRMITALAASQEEIRQYQELLEERIRQRTQELEKAMHGALAASQAKSEFLANISHELRTPMNGLLGMLDLVLDSPVGGEQREQIEIAQRCAYSLLDLLNDILDLSKIEAGRMILEKVPFDLRSVAEDCVRAQGAKAQQKGVELRFEYDGDVTNVTGDPLRLRQIVANLLSNAIKFTEKGWVSVRQSVSPGRGRKAQHGAGCGRYRSGHSGRKGSADFRKIHAGRFEHQPQVWRHRAGAGDYEEAGGIAGRTDPRGEPGRAGEHVYSGNSFRDSAGRGARGRAAA